MSFRVAEAPYFSYYVEGYLSSHPERPFPIALGSSHPDPDVYERLGPAVFGVGWMPVLNSIDHVFEKIVVWLVEVARVDFFVGKVAGP